MKVTQLPFGILLLGALAACNSGQTSTNGKDSTGANPFFTKSSLPFEAPDFTKIKDADFKPAIEEGIKQQQAEIQAIAEDTAAPTFENTLVALEKSGALLTRVRNVFDLLADANTNGTLDKVREDEAAALAANDDAIYLNTKLFKRVHDAYSWFEENGGLTRANGQRFRDMILSRGNTLEYGKMFRDFRGHDPEIGPLLKSRGLK